MDRRADRVAAADSSAALGSTAIWVLAVQCLLALSWTMYVLFLPGMLAAAGIERRWFLFVLMADQLIFAACDWAAGVYVDQMRNRIEDLLPDERPDSPAATHLNSVLLALSSLEKNRGRATRSIS